MAAKIENTTTYDRKGEVRALLSLGWPIVLTQLFIMLTGSVDSAMAGHYSSVDLAGVSLGGMFFWPAFMLLTGLTMALTPIASQLRGAQKTSEIGHQIRQGLWVCVGTSTLLVLIVANVGILFETMEVDPAAAKVAQDYLIAVSWGVPPIMFYVALRHVCEGLAKPVPPMIIAGLMIPVNLLLNHAFVYGNYGLPELGGVGCGYATAIVFWLELGLMLFVCRAKFFTDIKAFSHFEWPHAKTIKSLIIVGLPIGLSIFVEMAVFSVVGLMIAKFGVASLAANSIAGNINWATYVIPAAIGSAASIRVGFHVGAKNYLAARQTSAMIFKFAIAYAVVVGIALVFARYLLVGIFTTDTEVVAIAVTLLLFIAFYQLVDDANAVTMGALRGYKDTRFPFYFGLVGYWLVGVPLGYALSEDLIFPGLASGVYGYWAALTIGMMLVAVCLCWRLFRVSGDINRIEALARV